LFNGPQGHLASAEEGNSNPLAGQTAFTGTDGGEPTGSWGTSVISLGRLGASPGDEVQFRFDMGRDGCNGVDGWYVDNVTISICEEKSAPVVTGSTTTAIAPKEVRFKKDFKVRVNVVKQSGGPAAGMVKIAKGRDVLAKGRLVDGKVVITVKRNLAIGKHKLIAVYLGNATTKPSWDRFTVRVVRR
jgi:hypothetical protein